MDMECRKRHGTDCSYLYDIFVLWPTKAQLQLIYKLSHSYVFRHYCVILRELFIGTLPSYTSTCIKIKKIYLYDIMWVCWQGWPVFCSGNDAYRIVEIKFLQG